LVECEKTDNQGDEAAAQSEQTVRKLMLVAWRIVNH